MGSGTGKNRSLEWPCSDDCWHCHGKMSANGPDGPGRIRVLQHFSPAPKYNSTFRNRCFLLQTDHWLYTRERALSVGLLYSW